MRYVGAKMRGSILPRVRAAGKERDALFLTSCVQHEMAWNAVDARGGPFGPTIGGCTHAEAVAQWVSGGNGTGQRRCATLAVDLTDDLKTLQGEECNRGVFH